MSILSIAAKVADYNRDKPNSIGTTIQHVLTQEDQRKIQEIANNLIKLNPPYDVMVTVLERSKQMYLKCAEKKKPEQKSAFRPYVNKGVLKA